jgi:DNA-binding GntR family transcriptional regulator
MALDEYSPVPYWEQLTIILKDKINSGEIQHRVPSLSTLVQEYEVSRNTVIRAITELENEGLVVSRQGRGTYVVPQERRPR